LPPNFQEECKVDYLKNFAIPFRGLKLGDHHFEYVIGEKFFDCIEYSEVKRGKLLVEIEMNKQERMLIFEFCINGTVEVVCDRCLDLFDYAVSGNEILYVKLGETWEEESDDMIVIPENEHEINVSQLIYEYIILMLPIQRIHPDDENGKSTCDPEMLEKLGAAPEPQETDPRWEALANLKKLLNN